jgi:hypothetical protein
MGDSSRDVREIFCIFCTKTIVAIYARHQTFLTTVFAFRLTFGYAYLYMQGTQEDKKNEQSISLSRTVAGHKSNLANTANVPTTTR